MRPPYLRHARWRSLSNAFMVWLACQNEAVRAEVIATKRQGRVILAFHGLTGVRGWVRSNCLAVYAVSESGDADAILELDSLPIRVEGTMIFVCGFCGGDRREFDGREALWADHLFEPFAEWVQGLHLAEDADNSRGIRRRTSHEVSLRTPHRTG